MAEIDNWIKEQLKK